MREDTTTGDDTRQLGKKANTAAFTTMLIINLLLHIGKSTKPIKENEGKKSIDNFYRSRSNRIKHFPQKCA